MQTKTKIRTARYDTIPEGLPVGRSAGEYSGTTIMRRLAAALCLLLLGSGLAFGGTEAEDAATIKGSKDAVVTGSIQRGRSDDTVIMLVNDCYRGDISGGKRLLIQKKGIELKIGDQYLVMGRVQDDGFFHVHPQIHYPYTRDKVHWVQVVLGILSE